MIFVLNWESNFGGDCNDTIHNFLDWISRIFFHQYERTHEHCPTEKTTWKPWKIVWIPQQNAIRMCIFTYHCKYMFVLLLIQKYMQLKLWKRTSSTRRLHFVNAVDLLIQIRIKCSTSAWFRMLDMPKSIHVAETSATSAAQANRVSFILYARLSVCSRHR